jgi:uncharacterized protein YggE
MAELVTTGQGEVERTADQADFVVRYAHRAKDRTAAVDGLAKRIGKVEPFLDRDGVTISSRRLSVHDVWEGKRRTDAEATQVYSLLVTDITVLNELVGDLILTEPRQLDGPDWTLADRTTAYREAQTAAVADARATAQGYADALGARLGQLQRLDDTSPGQARPAMYGAVRALSYRKGQAPDVAELSLEPQPVTVQAMCSITWELLT